MDIEIIAARLEAEQAQRDYSAAYKAFQASVLVHGPGYGSSLDYAVWSTAGYADSALRAVPVVKRPRKKPTPSITMQYRKMNDGVKGKRDVAGSIVQGRRRVGK